MSDARRPCKVHIPDWSSITHENGDLDTEQSGVIDVSCFVCGFSGSAVVEAKDINWD